MIDQSDTWRFDMPNLPHEITKMIIDTGQNVQKECAIQTGPTRKKYVVLKKPASEKNMTNQKYLFCFLQ